MGEQAERTKVYAGIGSLKAFEGMVGLARVGGTDVHVDDSRHLSRGGIPLGRVAQVGQLFLVVCLGFCEASTVDLGIEEIAQPSLERRLASSRLVDQVVQLCAVLLHPCRDGVLEARPFLVELLLVELEAVEERRLTEFGLEFLELVVDSATDPLITANGILIEPLATVANDWATVAPTILGIPLNSTARWLLRVRGGSARNLNARKQA